MSTPYDPHEVVPDGPYTAPRVYQHLLKAFIALSIYAAARDLVHLAPLLAGVVASPLFMIVVTVKEWYWPSDVNEHSYSWVLRADDFVCDFCCTVPALVLGLTAVLSLWRWIAAALVATAAFRAYRATRHNARP